MAVGLDVYIVNGPHATLPSLHSQHIQTETEASDTNGGCLLGRGFARGLGHEYRERAVVGGAGRRGYLLDGQLGFPDEPKEVVARYQKGPIVTEQYDRRNDFFRLQASIRKAYRPRHIITADSPEPKEIDDGVFVEALPSATEMYRVGVCLPNTAKLYLKHEILRPAIAQLHADYRYGKDDIDYTPLIDEEHIREYEMSQGNRRKAMVLRFYVGQNHPPSDASISFENVYVDRNYDYRKFSEQTGPSQQYERYARAGHYIMEQLRFTDTIDNDAIVQADTLDMVRHLVNKQPERLYLAGSYLTSIYMVATNHLSGLVLGNTDRLGLWRVFDPQNTEPQDFLPSNMARFSTRPGPHAGLKLSNVLPVSSPLRRVHDGINGVQLWKLDKGMRQDAGDVRIIEDTAQLLNIEAAIRHRRKLLRRYKPRATDAYLEEASQDQVLEAADTLRY